MDGLRASEIRVHFEGVKALDGIDFALRSGEILGLIGPNGAGKTTLVNVLTGFQTTTTGRVTAGDVDVTGWSPERRARLGLARTFQSVRVFGGLSVLENVELGAVGTGLDRREARRRAWGLLEGVGLAERAGVLADALPFGEERRVGIARALAMDPVFLLLDEPGAGLTENETDELMTVVRRIRAELRCGVLVIEHDMRLIMRLCDRIHVLDYGKTIAVGTPSEVRADDRVIGAYLGTKREQRLVGD